MYVYHVGYSCTINHDTTPPTTKPHLNHSWSWRSPSIYGNGPPGRSYHSATVVGGHMVILFGGNDGDRCYNRVHVLQVRAVGWY